MLFEAKVEQSEISAKMTSKAVSWLVGTCWTNDLDNETLWLSILLFYCYKANRVIHKGRLELLRNFIFNSVLSVIYISSKKCEVKKCRVRDVLDLTEKEYTI